MTVLAIPELLDEILTHVSSSGPEIFRALSLCACALVSRSWTTIAQRHLFSQLELVRQAQRPTNLSLVHTLTASPQLAAHVRHLSVATPAPPLSLPRLQSLVVVHDPWIPGSPPIEGIQHIIRASSATLRTIKFAGSFYMDTLAAILSPSSLQNIETVDISGVISWFVKDRFIFEDEMDESEQPPLRNRCVLKPRHISLSKQISAQLTNHHHLQSVGLGLERLTSLSISPLIVNHLLASPLNEFLWARLHFLEVSDIFVGTDIFLEPVLNQATALRTLQVRVINAAELEEAVLLLGATNSPHLHTFALRCLFSDWAESWPQIYSALAALDDKLTWLPTGHPLQKVELLISRDAEGFSNLAGLLCAAIPSAPNRGITVEVWTVFAE
ncbi:hypothetical protein HMN09_00162400 [Mycena chlorophos]|uniref:F-box domain-containing protein n=1 Tax=Mycena chlorophos TaxID=658473 RepID=A0A8H6TPI0_MYCCL|nr:hypothetical protein HMN09_00162400 [Mycena chlorophos]